MKKIVSLVIVITMMLCMFPISTVTASAATTTDFQEVDLSDEALYPDGGTYTDTKNNITYTVVRSATTFKAISKTPEGNYILAKDISIPGTYENAILGYTTLSGIINGNGYAIKHFSVTYEGTYGSFGVLAQGIKNSAKIVNLSIGTSSQPITYAINNAANNNAGAGVIAGKILSDSSSKNNTVEISGVDVYCNISVNKDITAGFSLGGFIGRYDGSNTYNLNVSNCSFTGDISFTDNAATSNMNTRIGGLIGYHSCGGMLTVSNFTNNADINALQRASGSSGSAYIGGIVGYAESETSFSNCINTGDITSDKYSGGILARSTKNATFTNCVNFGSVSSNVHAGGIMGCVSFNNDDGGHSFSFENCVNHGEVLSNSGTETGTKASAGGIIGFANFGTYTFNKCGNTGNISASFIYDTTGVPKLGACGIIGRYYVVNSNTSITSCYSTGTISSSIENDTRSFTPYAICTGSANAIATKLTVSDCVWNMTFNNKAVTNGVQAGLSDESGNNAQRNILAKESSDKVEARVQKSNDGTKIRVLLLTDTNALDAATDITVKIWCGNTGKQFTVPANKIFALESVDAAGETYYGVGGAYIFGAVVTGIPEDVMDTVTDVTVEYGSYSADFTMTK